MNTLFLTLFLCIGCIGAEKLFASELLAQWQDFNGLSSKTDLPPHAGLALRNGTWALKLNGGKVENGVLSTGTTKAPMIDFNGEMYQVGGWTFGGYTLVMKVHPPKSFVEKVPFWELSTKVGMYLDTSKSFRGIWDNKPWDNNSFSSLPFSWSEPPQPTTMVFVAPDAETQSKFAFQIFINGKKLNPDPKWMTGSNFKTEQISFGNFPANSEGGLDYQIESISIYNGLLSETDIQKLPFGTLTWQGVSGSDWSTASSWKELQEYDSIDPSWDVLFLPKSSDVCTAQVSAATSAGNTFITGGNYQFSGEGPLSLASLTLTKQAALTINTPLTIQKDLVIQDGSALTVLKPVEAVKNITVQKDGKIIISPKDASFTCEQPPRFAEGTVIRCIHVQGLEEGFYPIFSWTSPEKLTSHLKLEMDADVDAFLKVVNHQLGLCISSKYIWNGTEGSTWNSKNAWLKNNHPVSYPTEGDRVLLNGNGIREIPFSQSNPVFDLTVSQDAGPYTLSGNGFLDISLGSLLIDNRSELSIHVPSQIYSAKINPEGVLRASKANLIEYVSGNGKIEALPGAHIKIANWGTDKLDALSIQDEAQIEVHKQNDLPFNPHLTGNGYLKLQTDLNTMLTMRESPFSGTIDICNTSNKSWIILSPKSEADHTPFIGRPTLINNCPPGGNPALFIGPSAAEHPIELSNLSGTGVISSQWDQPIQGKSDVRTFDLKLTHDCNFRGYFSFDSARHIQLVVGCSVPNSTLTLSGNNRSIGNLEIKDSARVALSQTGRWCGPISIAPDATLEISRLKDALDQKVLTLNGTLHLVAVNGILPQLKVDTIQAGPSARVTLEGTPKTCPTVVFTCNTLPAALPKPPAGFYWEKDPVQKTISIVRSKGIIMILK